MKLIQNVAPATEPVDLADAKAHLRVDLDDDDALITAMITAARQRAEQFMQKSIITQQWYLYLDYYDRNRWLPPLLHDRDPERLEIKLPFGPIQSLDAFEYLSAVNPSVWTAVDSETPTTLYYVDLPGEQIVHTPYQAQIPFPCPVQHKSGLRVSFTAGWGSAGSDVPQTIILGIKTILLHFYENRTAYQAGTITEMPMAGEHLLQPHRAMDY